MLSDDEVNRFSASDYQWAHSKERHHCDRHVKKGDIYQFEFEDGLIYAVGMKPENEALIRRVYRQDGSRVMLVPCNSKYSPIVLDDGEVFLIGKAVGVYREIE